MRTVLREIDFLFFRFGWNTRVAWCGDANHRHFARPWRWRSREVRLMAAWKTLKNANKNNLASTIWFYSDPDAYKPGIDKHIIRTTSCGSRLDI